MRADTPVIVGMGEVIDRPEVVATAPEPRTLAAEAARRADRDAGGGLLAAVDALDIVNIASWRHDDIAALLCRDLAIDPALRAYHPVGGESPVRLLHEAALRIARGESRVALICGAEAQHSVMRARREGIMPDWTPFGPDAPSPLRGADIVHPLARRYGLTSPTHVYPLFEMASAAAWGQTPAQARAESGALWAHYAAVAAGNPMAWRHDDWTAEQIVTPADDNRLIAWPYTKRMVANPQVNMGAAILMTRLDVALEAGIAADRLIHVHGGAAADEPRDFLARDGFAGSPAQEAVLNAMTDRVPGGFDALELYSCFPCVPKMARRSLGLGADIEPSVTGGLSFFGGPLSVYMLHAACAMVRCLRGGGTGLLYGQGEFVTKHHALLLSADAAPQPLAQDYSVQADADRRRGAVPPLVEPVPGPAQVETATILYRRDGAVDRGVVVLRTAGGARTLTNVSPEDQATLSRITDDSRFPVGLAGRIAADGDRMIWRAEGL